MTKQYAIQIKGKNKRWSFPVQGTKKDAKAWEKDGLEVVEIVENE